MLPAGTARAIRIFPDFAFPVDIDFKIVIQFRELDGQVGATAVFRLIDAGATSILIETGVGLVVASVLPGPDG